MKKLLSLLALLMSMSCFAALPPGVVGKKIFEYPNQPAPNGTYLFLLDLGNGTYYNLSVSQLMAIGTTNFGFSTNLTTIIQTNNTFVNTNVFISTSNAFFNNTYASNTTVTIITNTTLITTNITIMAGGGLTNYNASPKTIAYWDVNDGLTFAPSGGGALTNDGAGNVGWFPLYLPNINGHATNMTFVGATAFDEGDFGLAYFTNAFFLHTNWAVVSFDGNGQPALGIPVAGTNLFLLSGNNITFTTNANGSVTIAASGSLNITTITNTTLYSTNIYVTTLYAQTNYSTNLFYVSGKGNTLIITNISIEGSATNKGVAASSAVITDAAQVETNAVNAVGAFTNSAAGPPKFGLVANNLLQNNSITIQGSSVALGGSTLAAGSSPSFNEVNSTNFNYLMPTNNGNGGALVFGGVGTNATLYITNITGNTTLAAFVISTVGEAGGLKLYATCSGGTDRTLTFPNGCVGAGSLGGAGKPPVATITNALGAWFDVIVVPGQTTNVFWAPVF